MKTVCFFVFSLTVFYRLKCKNAYNGNTKKFTNHTGSRRTRLPNCTYLVDEKYGVPNFSNLCPIFCQQWEMWELYPQVPESFLAFPMQLSMAVSLYSTFGEGLPQRSYHLSPVW